MPLIPILQIEEKIQVNDKTRLSATKTFKTTGEANIAVLTLKPDETTSAINIFNADSSLWYLDWVFSDSTFDIDSTINKLYVQVNSVDYIATVTSANYTFSTLASAIQTALNALAAGAFTITISNDDKLTIACTNKFIIQGNKPLNNLLPHVGFTDESSSALSHDGDRIEYGIKKLTLTVNNGGSPAVKSFYNKVYTLAGDNLFSNDNDLIQHESDILSWAEKGRTSFLNVHRRSQELILDWLYQNGYTDQNGDKLNKYALINKESIRLWSAYQCLYLIFMGLQNANDDVFKEKAQWYEKLMINARQKAILELDIDGDGDGDEEVKPSTWSGSLLRR